VYNKTNTPKKYRKIADLLPKSNMRSSYPDYEGNRPTNIRKIKKPELSRKNQFSYYKDEFTTTIITI
jgi:hypothetical protein